jgi:phage replication initiation protein
MDTPKKAIEFLSSSFDHADDIHSALIASSDADCPPSGNTGGKLWTVADPETGEVFLQFPSHKDFPSPPLIHLAADWSHPYAAITDFLNCTFKFSPSMSLEGLFTELFAVLGEKFAPAVDRRRGLHGYQRSFQLGNSSAIFAVGGQAGTAYLSLPGSACALISDWHQVVSYLRDSLNANVTRWDGAVDDYLGTHSVDDAVALFLDGQFTAGGNTPSCNQHGNWIQPDGSGRTFYVGKRKNGKMLRVYEKGMQLGGLWHPWVRWEVELHNKDRIIPWEVLLQPGRYFVGCYPSALNWAQVEMSKIRTLQKQSTISYEHLTTYAAVAYGPLLNVMLKVEGSADAVLKKLHRHGTPRRLKHPFIDTPSDFIDKSGMENPS